MINFKVLNDNFFLVENTGIESKQYPRWYEARITGKDYVRVAKYNDEDVIFDNINFTDFTVEGVAVTSGISGAAILNDVVYKNLATTSPPPPPALPKIIQSIPMQDATGLLVWKNILDDGTFTYTMQNGTAYAGATNSLLLSTALIVATDNYSMQLPAGNYTRAQVLTQAVTLGYTLGKNKIHQVQFIANNGGFVLKNTAGLVQLTADDFTNTEHLIKGNSVGTQLEEVDDFLITVTGNVLTNLIIF
jgi:hypothetical protein